ncbi:hypothetical protein PIB19_12625 [Sphingomonas sp. 7/4-4]|uniref:hypothetical protein n=1 Tax=Sphingomonas sp. 7/4-4 TaxID=3018446 RepID=UPI0022F3A519|nr:hypothetical protein [Sphingomonas sp. 7/4-4]WBY06441.1 hypothetical protein PIB19_12625 [Sphingomonas sp. 7/4-4]
MFPARHLMGGGDVPLVPLLSGGPLDTEMARITQFRDENDLPEYVRGDKTGTVAVAHVGDDHFYGTNSGMPTERTTMTAADIQAMRAIMHALGFADPTASQNTQQHFTHAEFAALYAASLRRGTMPEVVELFVDRDTCESCQNHLDRLAGYFGIKELRVYFFNAPPPQPVIYKGRGR